MPIDTPYNREIAKQYTASNYKRADYMQNHMSSMKGGELVAGAKFFQPTIPQSGMVGGGVGVFNKIPNCGSCTGGSNPGLKPSVRRELDLGAGKPMRPNTNAGLYAGAQPKQKGNRAQIVMDVMKKHNLGMIAASKYVKENNLY